MQTTILWTTALAACFVTLALALIWALRRPANSGKPLPVDWSLTARPVFSADERRVYRLLKEALPHHIILSKLPLVRFCQPTEAKEVRYWYELLGSIHVSFAVCSPNGRVLAAVDLDSDRGMSGRSLQIKQQVLGACRVRYLRCPIDNLPSAAELQLLVPFSNSQSRGPQPAPVPSTLGVARPSINGNTPRRHAAGNAGRSQALWQDSSIFNDSFFAPDSRFDPASGGPRGFQNSRPFAEALNADSQYPDEAPNDIVGMVVESPRYGTRLPR